jgi:hypothetical protein
MLTWSELVVCNLSMRLIKSEGPTYPGGQLHGYPHGYGTLVDGSVFRSYSNIGGEDTGVLKVRG